MELAKSKQNHDSQEKVLIDQCHYWPLVNLLAMSPAIWLTNFAIFIFRSHREVLQPKWQSISWIRNADPRTWPDPKDLEMPLHYTSIAQGLLVCGTNVLAVLIISMLAKKSNKKSAATKILLFNIILFIFCLFYFLSYFNWLAD